MKEDIRKHCKTCATCQLHKLEKVKFERKIFRPSLQPMDFICMDLIGEFHPPDKSWTPLCTDSCLYAYRVYMVCTFEDKDSRRGHKSICRATTRPPHPSSTAECLRLIARLREDQTSAASWEPRPPFEAAKMD